MSKKLKVAYQILWDEISSLPEPLRNEAGIILARLSFLIERIERAEQVALIKVVESH